MKALKYIRAKYSYASILHDKDLEDDGKTPKKPHYHVIIYVGRNPRNRRAIAKEMQIKENYIEGCNKEAMLLYLIHYNHPKKTQYDIEEVEGNLKEDLIDLIMTRSTTQKEKLDNIIAYIESCSPTLTDITKYCIEKNYYTILKQNQYLIQRLVEENRKCQYETIKPKLKLIQ